MAKISKAKANECARVVAAYAKQEAKSKIKKGAKYISVHSKAISKRASAHAKVIAKNGFKKLKSLFSS